MNNYSKKYQPVIGLEIHIELKTKTKMFCGCPADHFGKKPNRQVCPICLGLPGALPAPNRTAIEWTIILSKALNCQINNEFVFARKHYFYPDLPKGYQITQYNNPIGNNGRVYLKNDKKTIRINRVHIEEDVGQLFHHQNYSLIDYNRAGVPLAEIVTEPEFDNAEDVKIFLEELQAIVRHLKISDADMHKGGMRLEPNISVRKLEKNETSQLPKYKVEIKNINSFAFVHRAIKYEIDRQIEILSKGLTPSQETRGFDSKKMITFFQRSKEAVKDYKYFPEPDIPPIYFSKDEIIKLTKNIPQLPDQIINRWVKKYGINTQYAKLLTRRVDILVLLENVLKTAKTEGTDINKLVSLIVNKKIFVENRFSVQKILDSFRELTVTYFVDEKEIQAVIKKVITENKKAVSNYQGGKIQALEFLLGKCLGLLKKGVNPTIVRNLLLKEL